MKKFFYLPTLCALGFSTMHHTMAMDVAVGIAHEKFIPKKYPEKLTTADYKAIQRDTTTEWEEIVIPLREKFLKTKFTKNEEAFRETLAKLEKIAVETERKVFPIKFTAALIAAGVLSPIVKASNSQKRSPGLMLGLGSILKEQGLNITAIVSIIYFGNKAIKWLHAPCKAEKDKLLEDFKKIVVETTTKQHQEFMGLHKEVLRETEQVRLNCVNTLVKVDDLEKQISSLEKKVERTDFKKELAPLKKELEKQKKALESLRKQELAKLQSDLKTLQARHAEALSSGASSEAISILAQELQKTDEKQRILETMLQERGITPTPSQSRTASPSNTPSSSHYGSLNVPQVSVPAPRTTNVGTRRRSISEYVPMNSLEEVSSASSSDDESLSSPKKSPRRHSICVTSPQKPPFTQGLEPKKH